MVARELSQWLAYLENRHSLEIQLGLSRILAQAQYLDLDKPSCKVITVAGTNGKGSTLAALESFYRMAGYQVGAYTSPHLVHFNERIRLNGQPIADADLCLAFEAVEAAPGGPSLSYFEAITLAALWYFKQYPLDILLLEVGLGGRLDATNIIDADLAIITTIDFDHQALLGDTLDAIGFEKAGILRQNKPFIYADREPTDSILSRATELSCTTYLYNKDYEIEEEKNCWRLKWKKTSLDSLTKPAIQLKSAAAAIVATLVLQEDLPIDQAVYNLALQAIFVPGRLQWQKGAVDVLYDVSHNPQSVALLAKTLEEYKTDNRKKGKNPAIHAVFSALEDKDIAALLRPLKNCVNLWYPAQLDCKRAASRENLFCSFKKEALLTDLWYNSPALAFESARQQANFGDLIVVFGSFYTVSAVIALSKGEFDEKDNG